MTITGYTISDFGESFGLDYMQARTLIKTLCALHIASFRGKLKTAHRGRYAHLYQVPDNWASLLCAQVDAAMDTSVN